jgi:hypothetical protein
MSVAIAANLLILPEKPLSLLCANSIPHNQPYRTRYRQPAPRFQKNNFHPNHRISNHFHPHAISARERFRPLGKVFSGQEKKAP